jgi:hypothetical protein
MNARDRRAAVLQSTLFNGIDFVEIANDQQTTLNVHFLNRVPLQGTLTAQPTIQGGETIRTVAVEPLDDASDWGWSEEHLVLTLRVTAPGDFSSYTLTIQSPFLDPFFNQVQFSFKARCPSDLDCQVQPPPCPPVTADVPPIDYLAKDFLSFRQALLDFSALRYPQWQERSEADFGMMFLEALSAVADDLSYTQDRIAAEAALETATQRRSVVRQARLVDYEPQPATSASVLLQFDVAPGVTAIEHGLAVIAQGSDGSPITFETGTGLLDRLIDPQTGGLRAKAPVSPANALWNAGKIQPYWFDDSQRCLKAGATQMYVLGHGYDFQAGQSLLIETEAQTTADPPIRQIVQLLDAGDAAGPWAVEECDALFTRPVDPGNTSPPYLTCSTSPPSAMAPTAVTRICWRDQDALTVDRDLTRTTVAGNLVPATQGKTFSGESFAITAPPAGDLTLPATVVRTGPRGTLADGTPGTPVPLHLYTLANTPVAWLPPATGSSANLPVPEILLLAQTDSGQLWSWFRRLLDAEQFNTAFTLDAARFSPIARNSDGSTQYDYDGDVGDTIRFGDGVFGQIPNDGTRFAVTYRVGVGAAGNVAADSITQIDPTAAATAGVMAVTNPLPATGGADAESLDSVRRLAPQAFRAQQFRAVLPADYQAAAQSLPWVQRAGTVFRWTGSWLTVFTTPDPLNSEQVTVTQRTELIDLLNRYRMAGYESYVPDARYVSLDLAIDVCALPEAFRGDVETGVVATLSASGQSGRTAGFFNVNNFTFGQPLERSALEAAIQGVYGVAGVTCIRYRVRGRTAGLAEMPDVVSVAVDEIIRCDNDPSVPEHGSLQVTVMGGK